MLSACAVAPIGCAGNKKAGASRRPPLTSALQLMAVKLDLEALGQGDDELGVVINGTTPKQKAAHIVV